MMISGCKRIVGGKAEGRALVTSQPINFLSMVDAKTGRVTDPGHELCGSHVNGVVLVFPYSVGSTVGAYAIYSLKKYQAAPAAMICVKTDITTASGCAIASIPLVDTPEMTSTSTIKNGFWAIVDADRGEVTVRI